MQVGCDFLITGMYVFKEYIVFTVDIWLVNYRHFDIFALAFQNWLPED